MRFAFPIKNALSTQKSCPVGSEYETSVFFLFLARPRLVCYKNHLLTSHIRLLIRFMSRTEFLVFILLQFDSAACVGIAKSLSSRDSNPVVSTPSVRHMNPPLANQGGRHWHYTAWIEIWPRRFLFCLLPVQAMNWSGLSPVHEKKWLFYDYIWCVVSASPNSDQTRVVNLRDIYVGLQAVTAGSLCGDLSIGLKLAKRPSSISFVWMTLLETLFLREVCHSCLPRSC